MVPALSRSFFYTAGMNIIIILRLIPIKRALGAFSSPTIWWMARQLRAEYFVVNVSLIMHLARHPLAPGNNNDHFYPAIHAASEFLHFLGAESQVFQPDCFFSVRRRRTALIPESSLIYLWAKKQHHPCVPMGVENDDL